MFSHTIVSHYDKLSNDASIGIFSYPCMMMCHVVKHIEELI